jgi:2-polyprenyl-6-methoxyphenol hydroxylase-like FAD-dependent oxidoreductase
LIFKDRPKVTADIVIGADGARSKVRPYITNISPQYSGTTLIQGEVLQPEISCPEIYNMVNQGSVVVLGDEKALIIQQKGDGNLIFYSTARQPENWINTSGINFNSNQEVIHFLEVFYKGWSSQFNQLFSAAFEFLPRPMYSTPVDQTWQTKENITIIGDAAHVMPPFAGVGVNMAMLDALELANCFTNENHIDLTTAFRVFEKRMLCRTAEMQLMTKDSEDIFHSPTAIKDLAIRVNSKS